MRSSWLNRAVIMTFTCCTSGLVAEWDTERRPPGFDGALRAHGRLPGSGRHDEGPGTDSGPLRPTHPPHVGRRSRRRAAQWRRPFLPYPADACGRVLHYEHV
ncbi:hypothetical protein ACE1SV_72730 [Streptomyces sp. E-15]